MNQFNIDPDDLNERVELELKRQKRITRIALTAVSMGLFVLFNIIAWGVLFNAGSSELGKIVEAVDDAREFFIGGMIMLDVGWAISILYHVILMVMDLPGVEQASRNRLTARMMGQMVQESIRDSLSQSSRPKSKRKVEYDDPIDDEPMTIGDDGELISEEELRSRKQTRR